MGDDREEIARIIDPWAFGIVANIQHTERAADDRAKALAKADAILARQGPGPGEAVAWRWRFKPWKYGDECTEPGAWTYSDREPKFSPPLLAEREVEPLYAATPTREA